MRKKAKPLRDENARLKKLVDPNLNKEMLRVDSNSR
jgi:hypothetical protein